jgi:uncharacterized RDD family membrane protein YckC
MNQLDWHHHEIPLVPRPQVAPAPRLVARLPMRVHRPNANRGDRLFAVVIDWIIGVIPAGVGVALARRSPETAGAAHTDWPLAAFVPVAILLIQYTLLSMRGQTLGKLAMRVRIVRASDGGNPGFLRAVVLRNMVRHVLIAVPILGGLFALVDILAIFGQERRCLHDRIAGTRVVEA